MGEQSEMLVGPSKGERTRVFGQCSLSPSLLFVIQCRTSLYAGYLPLVSDAGWPTTIVITKSRIPTSALALVGLLRSSADFNAVRVRDGAECNRLRSEIVQAKVTDSARRGQRQLPPQEKLVAGPLISGAAHLWERLSAPVKTVQIRR